VTLIRRAIVLSSATVAWNAVVGGAAVATAVLTGALSLIGFGVTALIDSSVSVLLIWRFRAEEKGHAERAVRAERLALRVAGVAFLAIAAYLAVQSVRALSSAKHPDTSAFGVAESLASVLVLPALGVAKYRLARRLGSKALRADGMLTLFGATLALVALAALLAERALGWWWGDAAGALVIAAAVAAEGVRNLRADA
jgi:divalent metal cation (Fe/Co/Zn/Cd) transporter